MTGVEVMAPVTRDSGTRTLMVHLVCGGTVWVGTPVHAAGTDRPRPSRTQFCDVCEIRDDLFRPVWAEQPVTLDVL